MVVWLAYGMKLKAASHPGSLSSMTAKMTNACLDHWVLNELKMMSITLFMLIGSSTTTGTPASYRHWNTQQQVMFPTQILCKAN
jgi:hypothetical protein